MKKRIRLTYKVQLLTYSGDTTISKAEPWFTTEALPCLHDCRAFVHWFACQVSTSFCYRFIEFIDDDDYKYIEFYPAYVQPPIECIHYPPTPLYLHIKKKRLIDRHSAGYFYEYPESPTGVYRNTPLNCIRF